MDLQLTDLEKVKLTKYRFQQIKIKMEINKPDKGVFKGIGPLQKQLNINKKNFPLIRNKHQFQFTHNHGNLYQSNTNYFYKSKFYAYSTTNRFGCQKVKKNSNQSQITLGNDKNDFKSLSQVNYKKYDDVKQLKPIYQKQQGIELGKQPNKNLFKTSNQQVFSVGRALSSKQNITYKDWRGGKRFNPITGQQKNIKSTFGFEDFKFNAESERKYKANNFTRIPKMSQKYDIISGRKLAYV